MFTIFCAAEYICTSYTYVNLYLCTVSVSMMEMRACLPSRSLARINFQVCGTPKKWTFRTQKVDVLNFSHLTLLQKLHFGPFCGESGPFADVGWCVTPSGYGPGV